MNKKQIVLLTDYKGHFGSKWDAVPYNSGFDKELLRKEFRDVGFDIEYIPLSKVKFKEFDNNTPILYTSSEDVGYHYKDYIEDIIEYLELIGANVVPSYKFLRANNNKVFMELMRDSICNDKSITELGSWVYGTLEEMKSDIATFDFPIVIKTAKGAMSTGVSLAHNKKELIKKVKKISRSQYLLQDIKDFLRPYKHKGYQKHSLYRNKFILQSFVPNLKSDYKILIFGERYYIFERPVRENDFRASGSGSVNYIYGSKVDVPEGIFDFAKRIFNKMNIPHLSLDLIYDGTKFYVVEYQALYFGTVGVVKSDGYYLQKEDKWLFIKKRESVENVYVHAIYFFLNKHT